MALYSHLCCCAVKQPYNQSTVDVIKQSGCQLTTFDGILFSNVYMRFRLCSSNFEEIVIVQIANYQQQTLGI